MSITISVTLTDKEYEQVKIKSQEVGLTISQYVKRNNICGDEFAKRYDYLIQKAKSQANGSAFTVMSLFPDWNDIPKGTKLSLGRNFFHLVKRGEVEGIVPEGKNSSNIQLYKSVKKIGGDLNVE